MKPLCFVLMPFGVKTGASGRSIDFDAVYEGLLRPAIERAEPLAPRVRRVAHDAPSLPLRRRRHPPSLP